MPSRALIIAIENYPPNPDLATSLPGTHANARAFRSWLKGSAGFADMTAAEEPSRIIIATDDPEFPGRTHDASARDIRRAVQALWTAGQNSTGELFVYYSGHGFLFTASEGSRAADVIVPGDFADMVVDGALCFRLDRLQAELLQGLGPGNHYYFIDACRNQIGSDQIDVGSPVRLKRSSQRNAQVFTLFSTSRLSTATAASPFTNLLVAGLDGRGKAKQPAGGVPPRMRVVWASLLKYMKDKLPDIDGGGDGASPSVLWEGPVQPKTCTILIDNAEATDRFTVNPADSMGRPQRTFQFEGASFQWQQPPDDYQLEVTHPAGIVRAVDPLPPKPVELFEDASARFVLEKPPAGGFEELEGAGGWPGAVAERRAVPAPTQVDVLAPEGSRVRMINPVSGEAWENPAAFASVARPGAAYVIEAFDRDNTLIVRRGLTLHTGEHRTVDLRFPDTPLRQALAAHFPSSPDTGVAFSESLGGSIIDPDLGLWLALIAASRVLGPNRFSKLGPLPLRTFDDVPAGGSALYVLAGFDDDATTVQVGVGSDAVNHGWHSPATVDGLPGLTELKLAAQPGGLLVSFAAGDSTTLTIASYALANRATVVTVTGAAGDLRIQQFLLPIHTLEAQLDPMVRAFLPAAPLRGIKFLAQSQRLLQARRSVSGSTGQISEWTDALYGKWLDPMAGIVACYELLRMGRAPELNIALDNLAGYFGELPDTAALLRLAGRPAGTPGSPPLVSDGYAAFPDGTFHALPESRREYGSLWTTWRNAIARQGAKAAGATA